MRIAFLCKRRYMSKDVVLDRYARLYEIPHQLARLGHEVTGYCLDYHEAGSGSWQHDGGPGSLTWHSRSVAGIQAASLPGYPWRLLNELRALAPDMVIGASDIPHVVLGAWLAKRLRVPYMADLYDNFEGFGQARIPGFVSALRWAVRRASLVTTTSEPLKILVEETYRAMGTVKAMPSSVDKAVFHPRERAQARSRLELPQGVRLIGTAGGLYPDKGVRALYEAWERIAARRADVHLVLAGPADAGCPPPRGERVHYLGSLAHAQVADLFGALDVGIISVLDTPFGRYCFPQKAYEMLACGLPVVAADLGAMSSLLASAPQLLFEPDNPKAMAAAVLRQLDKPVTVDVPILDWQALIGQIEPVLASLAAQATPD
jgi:teichuronic acid biosynthesis glycosyltransferase TuaC